MTEPAADDLSDMTKAELIGYAKEIGIGGVNSAMNKADIIAAIQAAE